MSNDSSTGAPPPRPPRVSPYLLVSCTMLLWSGNVVIGRALYETIPPFGISFWRWSVAAVLLLPFSLPYVRAAWANVVRDWKMLALLAFLLIVGGNTVLYAAIQYTTAINASIVNAAQPVLTVVLAWLILGDAINRAQGVGVALSLGGVLAIVLRGDPGVLISLSFNPGDVLMVLAIVCWAVYSVLLKRTPPRMHPIAFLQVTVTLGALMVLPLYLWESAYDRTMPLDWISVSFVLYAAVPASLVAVVFWNLTVAAVGPGRAGVFVYLLPLFTTLFALLFLDESLKPYHVAGFALIVAGIYLMTRGGPPTAARP